MSRSPHPHHGHSGSQQQHGSVVTPASTQLEFTQAMTDFRVMFPDMEADVIEAVLRANNGAVDATIDHLLAMTADNEAEKAMHGDVPPSYHPSSAAAAAAATAHPPSYQQATQEGPDEQDLINLGPGTRSGGEQDNVNFDPLVASDLDSLGAAGGGGGGAGGSRPKHAYSHPTRQEAEMSTDGVERTNQTQSHPSSSPPSSSSSSIVPTQQMLQDRYEENLRRREETKSGNDAATAQFLADERLALMMQNEEFMAELRGDREFMSTLQAETDEMDGRSQHFDRMQDYGGASSTSARGKMMMDEAVFREKLKNMGKASKRKFSQLASMFSRRKGAKELLGKAPAPSKDNLLLSEEPILAQEESESESDNDDDKKKTPTKGKYSSFS